VIDDVELRGVAVVGTYFIPANQAAIEKHAFDVPG
jgi:hypothetical protein